MVTYEVTYEVALPASWTRDEVVGCTRIMGDVLADDVCPLVDGMTVKWAGTSGLPAGSDECSECKGSGTVGKPGFLTPCDFDGEDDDGEWYCDNGAIGRHDERVESGN
jgi:hypothetical protein